MKTPFQKGFLSRYGSSDHIHQLIDSDEDNNGIFKNPNLNSEHIEKLYNTGLYHHQYHISINNKTPSHILDQMYRNSNESIVRSNILSNPNTRKETIDYAIDNEKDDNVILHKVSYKKILTKDQLEKLSKHKNKEISSVAKDRLKYRVYIQIKINFTPY